MGDSNLGFEFLVFDEFEDVGEESVVVVGVEFVFVSALVDVLEFLVDVVYLCVVYTEVVLLIDECLLVILLLLLVLSLLL